MSPSPHLPSRPFVRLVRGFVALLIAASIALAAAQRAGTVGPWWLELSRYLPYPALLLPSGIALLLAFGLGRRWIAASLAALGMVAGLAMGFAWGRADTGAGTPLRLMTYNVKAYKAALRDDGLAGLLREVSLQHPDIFVAQDNHGSANARLGPDWASGRAFGLPYTFAVDQYIVASRYPLRNCVHGVAESGGRTQTYAKCEVDVNGIALRVATVHLESPRGGLMAARREGLEGADDWERNYDDRLGQARALADNLERTPHPLIVAGDLNAPEPSAVVGSLRRLGLRDAFSSAGRGYGYSYGQQMSLKMTFGLAISFLRIDHILVSREVGVVDCFVGDGAASDHRPVIADLLLRRP